MGTLTCPAAHGPACPLDSLGSLSSPLLQVPPLYKLLEWDVKNTGLGMVLPGLWLMLTEPGSFA